LLALDLATEMEGPELRQRILQSGPADIHLVEGLHGCKAGGAALVGGAGGTGVAFG